MSIKLRKPLSREEIEGAVQFCGDRLLVSYLRPSKIDGAKHAWAILALLVKRLRRAWPKVKIVFRGDMENRIKEQQLHLFADRTSCHQWWPNQYRVLLSALAYVLLNTIRRVALAGTELARAYVGAIRLKLLKIGAVVLRITRRVQLLLSSTSPASSKTSPDSSRSGSAEKSPFPRSPNALMQYCG